MLTRLTEVVISKYIRIVNHVEHLKLMCQLLVYNIPMLMNEPQFYLTTTYPHLDCWILWLSLTFCDYTGYQNKLQCFYWLFRLFP